MRFTALALSLSLILGPNARAIELHTVHQIPGFATRVFLPATANRPLLELNAGPLDANLQLFPQGMPQLPASEIKALATRQLAAARLERKDAAQALKELP